MTDFVRLLAVTGSRADFGLWMPIVAEVARRSAEAEISFLVTAMHLDRRFGETVGEVRGSGVRIAAEIPCTPEGDTRAEMAAGLGEALRGMSPVVDRERPDWLLVLGDRGEQVAAALAALHVGIPIAHLHGGEVTRGAVDDTLRDLLTKMAHLHLVATEVAAGRLRAMGEEPWRIRVVGAPGLDLLRREATGDLPILRERYGLGDGPYLLVVQHPETVGTRNPAADLEATLAAVRHVGLPTLVVLPNADAGGRAMASVAANAGSGISTVASLIRSDYATLLAGAAALVGNSSSGIIEAPMLAVPAVNIGDRQAGRTRGDNVVDVPAVTDQIEAAIRRVVGSDFRDALRPISPYGDGSAAPRIVDALLTMRDEDRLVSKRVGVSRMAGA